MFFMMFVKTSFAQEHYFITVLQQTNNFYEIEEKVENYYLYKDKGKGSGYKQWKRWQHFYKNRLMPDGTIPNLGAMEIQEVNNTPSIKNKNLSTDDGSSKSGNWSNINLDSYSLLGQGYNGGLGRVNCVAVDPANSDIIYVGTPAGGLWRSTTGGNSWEPLTDSLTLVGVSGIAIDYNSPENNRTIYILTGDGDGSQTYSTGVLKSIDNGISWESTGLSYNIQDFEHGYKLVMDPNDSDILMVAMRGGIYRSTDGGQSWGFVLYSWRVYDIEFKPGDSSTVYAAGNGYFYKSTDNGASWDTIDDVPYISTRYAIAVTPADNDYVYLLTSRVNDYGEFSGLYRSTDSGDTFSLRSNTPNILGYSTTGSDDDSQGWYDLAIVVSPTNAEEVHTGGVNCWKSTNGGSTWENTSYWYERSVTAAEYTHADIHALEYANNTLFVASDGGVYKSENAADTWESISNGLNISQPYKIGLDPTNSERFTFGNQDNGTNKYEDGTKYHWFGADGFESIIDPSNPDRIYGSYQNGGLFRSDNNGLSVTYITPRDDNGSTLSGPWSTPYTLDSENTNIIYGGYEGEIYKSSDRGNSWSNITNGDLGFNSCVHIAVAPSNNDYIYVVKSSAFYYSHDGGESWEINGLSSYGYNYVAVNSENPNVLWLTSGNFNENEKVYKSTDGGETFTNISGSLPNVPANCIAYQKGTNDGVYVGTDIGVFYKDNSLTDWQLFSDNFPNTIVSELEIQYLSNKIYAATFGRGVWVSDLYSSETKSVCISSYKNWSNTSVNNQTSDFESTFSVTPNTNNMDGVIGLSNTSVSTYGDMGILVRFNQDGKIDVRKGAIYTATNYIDYSAGNTYDFRIVTNFGSKTYSVYASQNGTEQLIADNFDFRSEQASLSNINNWATYNGVGTFTVCDFEITDEDNENLFPTVVMTSPFNNATFEEGSSVTLSATANDKDGNVVRVSWYENDTFIMSDTGEPYSKVWENVAEGTYILTATVEDDEGAIVTSEPITINVNSVTTLDCITANNNSWSNTSLSNQTNNFESTFSVIPNTNNMDGVVGMSNNTVTTYGDMGMIVRFNREGKIDVRNGSLYTSTNYIDYTAGSTYDFRIVTDFESKKYSVYVSQNGSEQLIADNFDFRSEQASIANINNWATYSGLGTFDICNFEIIEDGIENILPTVVLTSPSDNATFEEGSTILLEASASDSDGNVSRVRWHKNDEFIIDDSDAPYSKEWYNVGAGTYILTATVEDNEGAISTSDPITITVNSTISSFCETTTTSFSGVSTNTEEGSFEANYKVTPNDDTVDAVVGLSNGQVSAYSGMAMLVRLNQSGVFDVRNGSSYSNIANVAYQAGTTYNVRIVGDIGTKKYNVYVAPESGTEVQIANNFDFRTDQAGVNAVNNWGWISGLGSIEVCLDSAGNSIAVPTNSQQTESIKSLIEVDNDVKISLVPNPASFSTSLLFDANHPLDTVVIYILDASGKLVSKSNHNVINYEVVLNISSLSNGLYFVQTKIGDLIKNNKLLVVD